jgi:hypothetical protein
MQFKYMQSVMDRRRAARRAAFAQSFRGKIQNILYNIGQGIAVVCIACLAAFIIWLEVTLAIVAFG